VVPRGGKGRGFCLYRAPGSTAIDPGTGEPYDDLLVIRCASPEEKQVLVEDETTPFFTVDHLRGSNAFLVQQSRLGEITVDELRERKGYAGLTKGLTGKTYGFCGDIGRGRTVRSLAMLLLGIGLILAEVRRGDGWPSQVLAIGAGVLVLIWALNLISTRWADPEVA
jgi:hypothetical protein